MLLPRPRTGLRGIVFTLSVCLSVCVSVCVCGQCFGILFLGYDLHRPNVGHRDGELLFEGTTTRGIPA